MCKMRRPEREARGLRLLQEEDMLPLHKEPEAQEAGQDLHMQGLLEHHAFQEALQGRERLGLFAGFPFIRHRAPSKGKPKILKTIHLLSAYCC
jgi:hypothetical protein